MKTIIIDYEPNHFSLLEKQLKTHYPEVDIEGYATSCTEAADLIEHSNPSLIFLEINMPNASGFQFLKSAKKKNFETILITHSKDFTMDAIKYQACGYLLKPLKEKDVIWAVDVAKKRIQTKNHLRKIEKMASAEGPLTLPDNLIGIPTLEGFEFISLDDIIRLEGYQRCTRIITKDRTDLLSSYNLGVFRNYLKDKSFYAPHKSHLINLNYLEKYLKEGTIKMKDGAYVPVAKRRKCGFIKLISFPGRSSK